MASVFFLSLFFSVPLHSLKHNSQRLNRRNLRVDIHFELTCGYLPHKRQHHHELADVAMHSEARWAAIVSQQKLCYHKNTHNVNMCSTVIGECACILCPAKVMRTREIFVLNCSTSLQVSDWRRVLEHFTVGVNRMRIDLIPG